MRDASPYEISFISGNSGGAILVLSTMLSAVVVVVDVVVHVALVMGGMGVLVCWRDAVTDAGGAKAAAAGTANAAAAHSNSRTRTDRRHILVVL